MVTEKKQKCVMTLNLFMMVLIPIYSGLTGMSHQHSYCAILVDRSPLLGMPMPNNRRTSYRQIQNRPRDKKQSSAILLPHLIALLNFVQVGLMQST